MVLIFLALFHGAGLHWILLRQARGERRLAFGPPRLLVASFLFGWAVFLMLALHMVEVVFWAFALRHMGLITNAYDAIYFCANCYTTLGEGKLDLEKHWRIMSPIIGISGLFTFAWTTSALVDVVASYRRLLNRMEDEREQEMHMRFAMRKQEWDLLKTEREAEQSAKEKAKTQAAGSSLVQRFSIWREERKRVAADRREKLAEIEDLRWQERRSERQVEAKVPAKSAEDKDQQ